MIFKFFVFHKLYHQIQPNSNFKSSKPVQMKVVSIVVDALTTCLNYMLKPRVQPGNYNKSIVTAK